jgi:hypothetical protein
MSILPITGSLSLERQSSSSKFVEKSMMNSVVEFDVNWTINGTMGNNGWYISPVTLTCTYNHSEIEHVYYGSGQEYQGPITIYTQGQTTFVWWAVRYDGSSIGPYSISFRIDYTPPTITLNIIKIGFMKWLFNVTVQDNNSGVILVGFYLDGQLLGNVTACPWIFTWTGSGIHSVQAIAYDAAGNSAASEIVNSFSYSQYQNQIPHQPSSSEHIEDFDWNTGIMTYHASLSGHITDLQMNPVAGARVRVYFHDTYAESYSDETGFYTVTDIPLCACVKNVSCTKLGYYPEYADLSITENAVHDFVVTPMPVYPILSNPSGKNGWFVTPVTIMFAINGSVNHTVYSLDGGGWIEYTTPIQVTTDGEHFLHWLCPNKPGDSLEVYWVDFKIDRTAPVICLNITRLSKILHNAYLFNAFVCDSISGIVKVEFYVDDFNVGNATIAPWEFIYQGYGKWAQAIVYDAAGNSAMSPIWDVRQPQVRCIAVVPDENSIVQTGKTTSYGTLTGVVRDTEMSPIVGARVRVCFHDTYRENYTDASGFYKVTNITICNCTKLTTCTSLGYYPESVWLSIDQNTVHDFVLTSMPLYPTLSGTMGENGWYISPVTITFTAHNFANHSFYALDEGSWMEYSAPFQVLDDGEHVLHWYWSDDQGNSSAVFWVNINIDSTKPDINLMFKKIAFRTWTLAAACSDDMSGINKIDFFVNNQYIGSVTNTTSWIVFQGRGLIGKAVAYDNAGNMNTKSRFLPFFRFP